MKSEATHLKYLTKNCCMLDNLNREVFDDILSFLWFSDLHSLSISSRCIRNRLSGKIYARMLILLLQKTGRTAKMNGILSSKREVDIFVKKRYILELAERITPYPTYFDWLANLVDWSKMISGSEFANNDTKRCLVNETLRPDNISCVHLESGQPHFRGREEYFGINSGRRALVYQGKELGGNRCVVANDHFPFMSAATNIADDFNKGIASHMEYPSILPASRIPFTKVIENEPILSCIAYFEVNVYEPKHPVNASEYSKEWLEANPPCVAIGIAYPSPLKKKRHHEVSRTESEDDLRSFAIDNNSNVEHFDTTETMTAVSSDDVELDLMDEEEHGSAFRLRGQLPGWNSQSLGYHSDDGCFYNGNSFVASESAKGMREFIMSSSFWRSLQTIKDCKCSLKSDKEGAETFANLPIRQIFQTPSCPKRLSRAKQFGPGDVVGCGIIYPPLSNYFTRTYKHASRKTRVNGCVEDGGILFFTKNGEVVYMTNFNEHISKDKLPRIARPWFPCIGLDSYCPVEFNFGHSDSNPFAFDVLALETYLLELKDLLQINFTSVKSCGDKLDDLQRNIRQLSPLPPLPPYKIVYSGNNLGCDSDENGDRHNSILSMMIRPLRLVTSLAEESPLMQIRSGRCSRGNFIDWTRSFCALPGSVDARALSPDTAKTLTWNDGVLSLLSCSENEYPFLGGFDANCNIFAKNIAIAYEARKGSQPPLFSVFSLIKMPTTSKGEDSFDYKFTRSKSWSQNNLSGVSTSMQPGHFKAWESVGEHLSAHSLFLNSSLSAAIKSLSRLYCLHSRRMMNPLAKQRNRKDLSRLRTSSSRLRLMNILQPAFGGDSVTLSHEAAHLASSAVEEVWNMILPGGEDNEDEDEDEDDIKK